MDLQFIFVTSKLTLKNNNFLKTKFKGCLEINNIDNQLFATIMAY